MKNLIYGKGYNDGSRCAGAGRSGKLVKQYILWVNMLRRCFDEKDILNPTYKGCTVSENFLNYSYFYDWCQNQIGFDKDNWQLDKDLLLVGNKTYSETTCVFVPQEINKFFNAHGRAKGAEPLGIHVDSKTGKYKVQCNVNGKRRYLGRFSSKHTAFSAYKDFKESLCKELALKWQHEIDPRVFEAMMKWEVDRND